MLATLIAVLFLAASCGSTADESAEASDTQSEETDPEDSQESADEPTEDGSTEDGVDLTIELFPDVLDAVATLDGDGSWTFSATLSSPYDSPQRYADAWRVVGPDGEVYGIRELTHDHASEQPFTRSQSDIEIPEDVSMVTVEGRDQVSGWGGATFEFELER